MDIKGMAIAIFEPYITEKFARKGYEQWLEALDPEARAIFNQPIDNGRWYPLRIAYSHPTEVLCRLFYDGDPRGAWELGRYSADHAFNWFFKSVIKLTTVQNFLLRASVFLSNYYHPAVGEVASIGKGRLVYRITGFSEPNRFAENRIAGWYQRALELHSCSEVRVTLTKSLSRGDPYTELDMSWQEG